jgi:hypothetical protein
VLIDCGLCLCLHRDQGFLHGSDDGGATWHALCECIARRHDAINWDTVSERDFGWVACMSDVKPSERNPAGQHVPPGKAYTSNGLEDTSSWMLHWVFVSFSRPNDFSSCASLDKVSERQRCGR